MKSEVTGQLCISRPPFYFSKPNIPFPLLPLFPVKEDSQCGAAGLSSVRARPGGGARVAAETSQWSKVTLGDCDCCSAFWILDIEYCW